MLINLIDTFDLFQVDISSNPAALLIYLQLQGSAPEGIVSAGIFGSNSISILDLPAPTDPFLTWNRETQFQSESVGDVITLMREGLAYVAFLDSTKQHVLRGNLGTSTCQESELRANSSVTEQTASDKPSDRETQLQAVTKLMVGSAEFAFRIKVKTMISFQQFFAMY